MKKKGQVDIWSGKELSKNKSFTRKGKLKVEFVSKGNKIVEVKSNLKERLIVMTVVGSLIALMLYFVFFGSLKQVGFFGT